MFAYMRYCTVKCVSTDVRFPGNHCNVFFRFTEEKLTLIGLPGEEKAETSGKSENIKDTFFYHDLSLLHCFSSKKKKKV